MKRQRPAQEPARRSSSSTRSIASTRPSRTRCCRPSRRALLTLIGATTENPAFEVNGALLSRTRVYALQALSAEEVAELLRRAGRPRRASTRRRSPSSPRAAKATRARRSTRWSWRARPPSEAGDGRVTLARVEDALQRRAVLYDKAGDRHYDYASAWIKATRGSDPDASLYYLAVMLEGGEDPRFIVRRMVILASEDIGNADPQALSVATAAAAAVEHVGLPEARYALAQAAIYLALAPKSDAAGRALGAAQRHVREHGAQPAPPWLRSGPRPGQDKARLRQPARPPRPRLAAAAAARGGRRRALLRARRGRGSSSTRACARFAGRADVDQR